MAIIDPSPTPQELTALAAIFSKAESSLQTYLSTTAGQNDPDFDALTTAAISLNNAADSIGVMQLHLATSEGAQAVQVINDAASSLQHAIIVHNEITHALSIVQSIVSFGAAIAAGDIPSIIESGTNLLNDLNGGSAGSDSAKAGAAGKNKK